MMFVWLLFLPLLQMLTKAQLSSFQWWDSGSWGSLMTSSRWLYCQRRWKNGIQVEGNVCERWQQQYKHDDHEYRSWHHGSRGQSHRHNSLSATSCHYHHSTSIGSSAESPEVEATGTLEVPERSVMGNIPGGAATIEVVGGRVHRDAGERSCRGAESKHSCWYRWVLNLALFNISLPIFTYY